MRNQLLRCDCREGMEALPDGCIPFTLTSPPYDAMRHFSQPWTFGDFRRIAEQLYRVTQDNGVVVWVVQDQIVRGNQTGTSFRQALFFQELGFNLHNTIIMARRGCRQPQSNRYGLAPEFAFVLSKGKPRVINLLKDKPNKLAGVYRKAITVRNLDGTTRSRGIARRILPFATRTNVWDYAGGPPPDQAAWLNRFPALMYESMAVDHILSWTKPGDLVFDPMMGAATTCKMALLNNRYYLGMELSQEYFAIAQRRMKLAHEQHRKQLDDFFAA